MQNSRCKSLVAFLFLEIWRHKISLWARGISHWIRIFTPENGSNFKKNESSESRIFVLDPKLTPHVNFSNFQAEKNFVIFKIFDMSPSKKEWQQPPWWINFAKIWSELILKITRSPKGHHGRLSLNWEASVSSKESSVSMNGTQ